MFDILGWLGMILVLIAYALLSTNKIENGKLYQSINFFAAVFMAIGQHGFLFHYKLYGQL